MFSKLARFFVALVLVGGGLFVVGTPQASAGADPAPTVPVGSGPSAVGVNLVTNKIYIANSEDETVSVIDGATDAVIATVRTGFGPSAVGVNPATNRIYVADTNDDSIAVIDGSSDTVIATVPVGSGPSGVAVNPVTDKIYVTNKSSGTVSVIDGSSDTVIATVPVGYRPLGVGVNPVTNKIYVANSEDGSASVIDGSSDTVTATISIGNGQYVPWLSMSQGPHHVGVNSVTNKIYFTNPIDETVAVIDGSSDTVTDTISIGTQMLGVGVNPATNRIHISIYGVPAVGVIDGASDTPISSATATVGSHPTAVGVNPVTNKIYVANNDVHGTVSVIDGAGRDDTMLDTTIDPLADGATASPTPTFTLHATSRLTAGTSVIDGVAFQVDTWQGPWSQATEIQGGTYSATTGTLTPGMHVLYAYAYGVRAATSAGTGPQSNPLKGNIAAYPFYVEPPQAPEFTAASPPGGVKGVAYSYTFAASGVPDPTFGVASGALPDGLTLDSTTGVVSGIPSTTGSFGFTIEASNGTSPAAVTGELTVGVRDPLTIVPPASPPQGMAGVAFSYVPTTTGGDPSVPVAWSLAPGDTLPDGLTLDSATGEISGTPSGPGKTSFTLVADGSETAQLAMTLTVTPAPTTTTTTTSTTTLPATSTTNTPAPVAAAPSTTDPPASFGTLPVTGIGAGWLQLLVSLLAMAAGSALVFAARFRRRTP